MSDYLKQNDNLFQLKVMHKVVQKIIQSQINAEDENVQLFLYIYQRNVYQKIGDYESVKLFEKRISQHFKHPEVKEPEAPQIVVQQKVPDLKDFFDLDGGNLNSLEEVAQYLQSTFNPKQFLVQSTEIQNIIIGQEQTQKGGFTGVGQLVPKIKEDEDDYDQKDRRIGMSNALVSLNVNGERLDLCVADVRVQIGQ
ncbi:Hypothetical_protein [Hexamita inflata]|uniref:Hypothetical_protein n=1 Tax=Hexamita inflata TaxID=28002 RepID=A0AA86PEU2_9EUKA|nr:Hypothetical protein HINF_LOCUS22102 [Hexamita inflata]